MELTNKQTWVLEHLRAHPEGLSVRQVSEASPQIEGTHGDRTYTFPSLMYEAAYRVLEQLRSKRLVTRRRLRDEWGDETPRFVYIAREQGSPDDPLEAAYRAPATEEPS